MLKVNNLEKSYGTNKVLGGVSFSIEQGSLSSIIGPSGGGKSVLMKIISGFVTPDRGNVEYGCITKDKISFMFQEGALFDSISVLDNVAFPLVEGRVPVSQLSANERREVCQRAFEALDSVGLAQAALKMPGQISGGMRRRVSLARAFVSRPDLMLLDDPTAGLDPVASSVIMNLVVKLHQDYRPTMLIISHDLRRLLPIVESVFCLFDGTIQFSGTVPELTSKASEEIKHFVACRFDLNSNPTTPERSPTA